jgi:aryl-alcohol dehydrogenase
LHVLEAGVVPIALWRAGSFPFDKLMETFPLSHINQAEGFSLTGLVIKPVLVPDEYLLPHHA